MLDKLKQDPKMKYLEDKLWYLETVKGFLEIAKMREQRGESTKPIMDIIKTLKTFKP